MSRTRSIIAAALLPLMLVAFTSCGKSASDSKSGSPDSSSSSKKEAADLDLKTLPEAMLAAMQDKKSAHMSMKGTGALKMDASGDMSFAGDTIAMTMKMNTAGQDLEMRVVDGKFYMTMPGANGKFVELGGKGGAMADLTKQFEDLDPKSMIDDFKASAKSVKHVGSETIDGDKTEHYTVVVDASKAAGKGADPSLKNVTNEIYLNKDNTPRRISTEVSGITMVIDYTDWGKGVTVKAPDASQIVDMPGM